MTISMLIKLLFIAVMLPSPAISAACDNLFPPIDYLHSKLQQNDIVFLGTTHKKPEILRFIAELIPTLKRHGVSHIGLEIPSCSPGKDWTISSYTSKLIAQNTGIYSRCS